MEYARKMRKKNNASREKKIVFFHSNHRILSLDSLYSFLPHPEGTVEPISKRILHMSMLYSIV